MKEKITLDQAQVIHDQQVEQNRGDAVVEWKSGEKQSEAIYEVVEGRKHLPGYGALGPGQRFHPTEKQVEDGSLRGKARELNREEYAQVARGGGGRASFAVNADLLGKIPMADTVREFALEQGLKSEDFEGVLPAANGQYTRKQVQGISDAKAANQPLTGAGAAGATAGAGA